MPLYAPTMSSYLLGVNALPTALHPTDRERSQNPVIGGIEPWQTSHLSQAPCPLQTGFAAVTVTKYISVITKANSHDTTLAYGTSWGTYTVYRVHTHCT